MCEATMGRAGGAEFWGAVASILALYLANTRLEFKPSNRVLCLWNLLMQYLELNRDSIRIYTNSSFKILLSRYYVDLTNR